MIPGFSFIFLSAVFMMGFNLEPADGWAFAGDTSSQKASKTIDNIQTRLMNTKMHVMADGGL